jgi:hypothetical protein
MDFPKGLRAGSCGTCTGQFRWAVGFAYLTKALAVSAMSLFPMVMLFMRIRCDEGLVATDRLSCVVVILQNANGRPSLCVFAEPQLHGSQSRPRQRAQLRDCLQSAEGPPIKLSFRAGALLKSLIVAR